MTARTICAARASLLIALTAACGERDVKLVGDRVDLRADTAIFENKVASVRLATPRANSDWSHRNGGPSHRIAHPALGGTLTQLFSVPIGQGDSRRARITAEPVVAGGLIYTLDAGARVTATGVNGAPVWATDMTPGNDNATDASGGGVTVAEGLVFVTTGFGELTALDAASGREVWTQDLDAPGTSAPTVKDGLVYVVARNSAAWALDVNTGRIQWQLGAAPSVGNFAGGAGVAVGGDLAVFPFPSGEVIATFPEGGTRRWSATISGERLGRAAALISDIAGDPVIADGRVYVGNFGGQLAALDSFSGERIWTAPEGVQGPVWPAGNAIFAVNDVNELIRLDAEIGAPVWRVALPMTTIETRRRQPAVTAHYGPILAGGRLIVPSSDGLIRQFDPASGAQVGSVAIADGAASSAAVAGDTMYVISKSGQLVAFR